MIVFWGFFCFLKTDLFEKRQYSSCIQRAAEYGVSLWLLGAHECWRGKALEPITSLNDKAQPLTDYLERKKFKN